MVDHAIDTPPRACIIGLAGPRMTAREAESLRRCNPWGVILMRRSCRAPGQVRKLVEAVWNTLGRECPVLIDQEGGRVQRLRPPEWPSFPAAAVYEQIFMTDAAAGREAAFLGHWLIAAELEALGIRVNCAPVLDLRIDGADTVIGDRAFGSDPLTVAELGRAALTGLTAGGVAGVIKHMPGHGRADVDSHRCLPTVMANAEVLDLDLEPFIALKDAPMGMTAHIAYEAFDPGVPATLSARVIEEIIRGRIGFDGLLISDDLGMQALGGSLAERTGTALRAGCDLVLYCAGEAASAGAVLAGAREVAEACPPMPDAVRQRAEAATNAIGNGRLHDLDGVRERHRGLVAPAEDAFRRAVA